MFSLCQFTGERRVSQSLVPGPFPASDPRFFLRGGVPQSLVPGPFSTSGPRSFPWGGGGFTPVRSQSGSPPQPGPRWRARGIPSQLLGQGTFPPARTRLGGGGERGT